MTAIDKYCYKGTGGNLCSRNAGHDGPCGPYEDEADSPIFAYSLAMYLTRNNQQHTFTAEELQAGIEQFMRERR